VGNSSGQPPFINHENDYELAMKMVDGMRPKIVPGTPLIYKKLMEHVGMLIQQKDLTLKCLMKSKRN